MNRQQRRAMKSKKKGGFEFKNKLYRNSHLGSKFKK